MESHVSADMEIAKNLKSVLERLCVASSKRTEDLIKICPSPRLVAVTKTKPFQHVIEAYKAGQIYFGENYVQELFAKSNNEIILEECPNIKWHMIGNLQSSKINKILKVPNLEVIETVDSKKKASEIEKGWKKLKKSHPLKVFAQINTSLEENKFGAPPEAAKELVGHILTSCPNLKFVGLMTIGAFNHDLTIGPNPDFQTLIRCRKEVSEAHDLDVSKIELSMGMSNDFEHAIEVGSTNIRVGSTIFGAREPKK